jgi:hypothetical protein
MSSQTAIAKAHDNQPKERQTAPAQGRASRRTEAQLSSTDIRSSVSDRPWTVRPAKIQDGHRQRLAIVYVRQSSPQQILEHRESRARQYALADHATTLGYVG